MVGVKRAETIQSIRPHEQGNSLFERIWPNLSVIGWYFLLPLLVSLTIPHGRLALSFPGMPGRPLCGLLIAGFL